MRSSESGGNHEPGESNLVTIVRSFREEGVAISGLLTWLPFWVVLVAALGGMVLAYQVPHVYQVDVGTPRDQAYVRNFHDRLEESGRAYRWSDVYGYVLFPGLGGSRPFTLSVEIDPGRSAPVTAIVNGAELYSQTLRPGWRIITLRIDSAHPAALASRDTVLELRAPDYRLPDQPSEPKGVKVSSVRLEQAPDGGFIVPSFATLAALLVSMALAYLLAGRGLLGLASLAKARFWALSATLIYGALLVLWLAHSHIAVSAASVHLVVTAMSALLLLMLCERFMFVRMSMTVVQRRVLAASLALAFMLRYGGMALPQSVIIDMPWHMKWLRTLLTGDWQSLYFPGGLSSVPREWGLDLLIPKSPLFYFAVTPLSILPLDLETLVKWLICFMDSTLVLAVFWLVLRAGGSRWAALLGAATYALMPLAFRALAYGILPTIFAQWLAVGALAYILAKWERRWRYEWVIATLLLSLALLAFPTVALFLSLVLLGWVFIMRWTGRVQSGAAGRAAPYWRILILLVVSWILSIWAYYGLYISRVITSATALLAPKPGGSTARWPGGFPELLSWTADYIVSVLPALLALIGLALLFAKLGRMKGGSLGIWLIAIWVGIGPLFVLVNYRVDMIGKHLFFTMVPVAVAAGVALWQVGRRGRWGTALMALALLALGWQGLVFWIDRLVRASS